MNHSIYYSILLLLFMSSCNPRVLTNIQKSYPLQNDTLDIHVIGLETIEPDGAEYLGDVRIRDTGFSTNCNYDIVIAKAQTEARNAGGNALKLTQHIPPSIWGSSCHQISARILLVDEFFSTDSVKNAEDFVNATNSTAVEINDLNTEAEKRNYQKFRAAVNLGYSYQLAKVSDAVKPDFRDYIKGLKSGYHYGGDVSYFVSEQIGLGGKYSMFRASNSIDNIYIEDGDGNRRYGKMSDDLRIMFVGPSFTSRRLSRRNSNAFLMTFAIGYIDYRNDKIVIDPYKMTGSTVGYTLDFTYDIALSENTSLGIQLSLLSGVLRQYKIDDGFRVKTFDLEEGNYEGLGRVDFSVGFRFHK